MAKTKDSTRLVVSAVKMHDRKLGTEVGAIVKQNDQLLEALQKLATFNISDGMSRYEMKEIARAAIEAAS